MSPPTSAISSAFRGLQTVVIHEVVLAASAALAQRATQQQQTAVPAAKKAKEEAQAEVINEPDTKIADGQGHRAMWGTVAEQSLTVLCDFVHQQSCDVRPCDKAS